MDSLRTGGYHVTFLSRHPDVNISVMMLPVSDLSGTSITWIKKNCIPTSFHPYYYET